MINYELSTFFTLYKKTFPEGTRILVACSGGPDSVALVTSLSKMDVSKKYTFMLGHVNHKLRGQASEKDAQFVLKLGQQLSWPVSITSCPIPKDKGNIEERARNRRYEALFQMARKERCSVLMTAHTLDDQVETLFLNLIRGTGPDGLGGIHPLRLNKKEKVYVARPLLSLPKEVLRQELAKNKFKFRIDASNKNPKFLRNWLRHKVVPLFDAKWPGFKERMAQLARIVREEQAFWDSEIQKLLDRFVTSTGRGQCLDFEGLLRYPAALQRRLLRRLMEPELLPFKRVEKLREWMAGPPTSGRLWQLRRGWKVERLAKSKGPLSPKTFIFRKEKP